MKHERQGSDRHLLIVGASGIVGYSAARHFARLPGWRVTALSRHTVVPLEGVESLRLDLSDRTQCEQTLGALRGITHVIFAAYSERPGTQGWCDPQQMAFNLSMLGNVLEPLLRTAPDFRHITLLQGTKAYGAPLAPIPIPSRERSPRAPHAVFYWPQEDYLREKQANSHWHWTILRPQILFGDSLSSQISVVPAIGVYASLLKQAGEPLYFPGGGSWIGEAVDADLFARACEWAAETPACRNEIFNITNGDVFEWRNVWPVIAETLGMEVGGDRPLSLAQSMPTRQAEWRDIVRRHQLRAPENLPDFVGQGFAYADMHFRYGIADPAPARLVSTVKARQAGFADCIDTEDMFRECFRRFQRAGLLPTP